MTISTEQAQALTTGRADVYAGSEKVGSVGQVYVDDSTGDPSWVTVKTGLFGTSESFVPLEGAELNGDDVVVSFSKDQIKNAPRVESDGSITPDEEDELYRYYGLGGSGQTAQSGQTGDYSQTGQYADAGQTTTAAADAGADTTTAYDADAGADTTTAYAADAGADAGADTRTTDQGAVGHDTSGPTTDDAMTRSEERVNVGTQTREAGRARLRKYVTTETVSQTVPVRHEEVTLNREPISDANVGDATSGPQISEEEHEVVLHEEVPVVEKEVVPVERIQLGTETVTEDTNVSTDVRKEQVELEDGSDTTADPDRR